MEKLEIKDIDALTRTIKVISWLDKVRWESQDNYNFIEFFRNDLTNSEKILTHWICCITNRQMPSEKVWSSGGRVFSEIVYEYSRNTKKRSKEILEKHYEKYEDKKGIERFRFKSSNNSSNNVTFASRYVTDDYQNILQTLDVLDSQKYKRNIMVYIVDFIQKFQSKGDLLIRVACGLQLLTYQLNKEKADSEEIKKILNDDDQFDKKLDKFKKTSTDSKKRLWCCVRDYKKGQYNEIFNNAIREVSGNDADELINEWNNLPMNQIELPGDVWNNSPLFKEKVIGNLINIAEIKKTWRMSKIIREIYDKLKINETINDFYPEQFDVTVDFVPRMCSKKLCKVCLFGPTSAKSICIPTDDKYCPVALVVCGYIHECKQDGCPIKEDIGKGICYGFKQLN